MQAPGFAPERVESLRLISSGGAGVSVAFVEEASAALGAVVKRTYGSTEAPTIATSTGSRRRRRRAHARRTRDRRGRAARRRRRAARARSGSVRRLPRRGAERRRVRRRRLVPHRRPRDPRRDGWLTIVGRLKDVIIRGGENISTAEVEHELEAHPDVRQAVVVGYPDALMGERVAAFVVGLAALRRGRSARVVRGARGRALQDPGARDRGRRASRRCRPASPTATRSRSQLPSERPA